MTKRHVSHSGRINKTGNQSSATYRPFLFIAAFIIAGAVYGAVYAANGNSGAIAFESFMTNVLTKNAASKGFFGLFCSSFFPSALLLVGAFVLGLCAVGMPGHIAIALFKGAGIGYSMGYVYIKYGLRGFLICAVLILPGALLTCFSILIACHEGIRFSFCIARAISPSGGQSNLWKSFNDYCLRYVFCFCLVLIAAIIESLLTIAFSSFLFS